MESYLKWIAGALALALLLWWRHRARRKHQLIVLTDIHSPVGKKGMLG